MRLHDKNKLWAMALGLMTIATTLSANPWYVSTNGVDVGNDGLSWAQSWRTISNAVAQATAGTIYVSNGVYVLSEQIHVTKTLTIEGFNGPEHTIVDGDGVTRGFLLDANDIVLRGFTVTNGYSIPIGNWARNNGGGVAIKAHRVTLDNCWILGNNAWPRYGGGVYVGHHGDGSAGNGTIITNCVIRGNHAWQGGGISLWGGGEAHWDLTLVDSEVSDNTVIQSSTQPPRGGGIDFQGNRLTVRDTRIDGNWVLDNDVSGQFSFGGGLSLRGPANQVLIENCVIVDNVISNSFTRPVWGGGIFTQVDNTVIRNSLIAGNMARNRATNLTGAQGGGINVGGVISGDAGLNTVIESCTIIGNEARTNWGRSDRGSGVAFTFSGNDVVRNCIVYHNGPDRDWFFGNSDRTNNVHYTATPVPMGGEGNITAEPVFVDRDAGNYRLRADSPGVNQGQFQEWMTDAVDLAGNPRIDRVFHQVDMGAYEVVFPGTIILVR